ncbi:olfactory receptor 1468-like [Erpetoichthys calabaricus]|uniref:olfactory receptor 1468-like n=1 Tax=Erpetoichthys calabaricus TaxID=27687 RepID=UPI00109FA90A|nr:olfactory receptor 1468-like [Erpetoichthys calabaricus]
MSSKSNNGTVSVSEFVLHCLIDAQQKNATISALTFIFLVSLLGNLLVILVILVNHELHAPMYIHIATLAVIDLANSTALIPKMISVLQFDLSVVPYGACVLQMFLILHVEEMESLLLTFMAIDRYIAVVYPLSYPSIITNKTVWIGILAMNTFGLIFKSPYFFFVAELSFCHTNILPYCFCDYPTMVHVSCSEDPKYLGFLSAVVFTTGVFPLVLILFSYGRIAIAALKISAVDGKKKVFSTCLTHLLVVGLFYIPLLLSYILPGAGVQLSTEAYNTMVIIGNVLPPMMNPMIYSFRNKEIKNTIYRLFTGKRTRPSD